MPHVYFDSRSNPPVFRFQIWDRTGKRRTHTGTASRRETVKLAQRRQAFEDEIRDGVREAPKLADKPRLFADLTAEYLAWGRAHGGRGGRPWSFHHSRMREVRLKFWQKTLQLEYMKDLDGCLARVEKALRNLKEQGAAGRTCAQYAEGLRAFCQWSVRRDYLKACPLKGISRFDTTPKTKRRALTTAEIQDLLNKCRPSKRLMYEVALATGLRSGELRSLTVKDLDVKGNALTLRPEWTKNRKGGSQPIPAWLTQKLAEVAVGKPHNFKLLYIPRDPIHDFLKDIRIAKIERYTSEGKIDFHALRVTYVTLLIESGVDPKTAQDLARHSTLYLTLNTYARSRQERLSAAAESVGNILVTEKKEEKAKKSA